MGDVDATPEQQRAYDPRELTLDLCGCAPEEEASGVTAALLACAGVEQVHVDRHVTWALVTFDASRTSGEEIVARLAHAGLVATVTRVFDQDVPSPPG